MGVLRTSRALTLHFAGEGPGVVSGASPLRPLRVHLPRFAGEDDTAPSQLQGSTLVLPCEAGEVAGRAAD